MGKLVSEACDTHFMFAEPTLQSYELITLLFKFIHSRLSKRINMLLQLFIQMVQIDLNLVKLLIFALLFHIEGFHFTLDNIANFKIK